MLEDGKPQKVAVFEFQQLLPSRNRPSRRPRSTIADAAAAGAQDHHHGRSVRAQIQYHDKRLHGVLLRLLLDGDSGAVARAGSGARRISTSRSPTIDMVAMLLYTSAHPGEDRLHRRPRRADATSSRACRSARRASWRRLADTGDENGEDTGAAFVADETEFNIFNTDRTGGHREGRAHAGGAAGKEGADLLRRRRQQDGRR